MQGHGPVHDFLMKLAGDESIAGTGIAAVVAHADDETLGLGAQLPRLPGIILVHVTDGAPRDLVDARRNGFATAEAYAAARRRELEQAAALVGIAPASLLSLGVPDQEAAFNLAEIARRLAEIFIDRSIETVFTHTYEGGHPDHEATAFAVHAAADLVARRNTDERPLIFEMPYYHAGPQGHVRQKFLPDPGRPELAVWLTEEQRALKARMFAAHATQLALVSEFPVEVERFRVAPDYDFAKLPAVDAFLYELENWRVTRATWLSLVEQARKELQETVR
jgi:LmbE family N-acetylglucosaminyl deacetylase